MSSIRPPMQQRSRESWERALEIATELFVTGGYEALSISEVCRRAHLSAPSLYARVDGLEGLFRAVYERSMAEIMHTEDLEFHTIDGSIERAVDACANVFMRHADVLRAVIRRSTADQALLVEGAEHSRRLQGKITDALPGSRASAELAARLIYSECAFRVIYGTHFWYPDGETEAMFRTHLVDITHRIIRQ